MLELISTKKFPIDPTGETGILLPYYRYEHRGTIRWHKREFVAFLDHLKGVAYIEEVDGEKRFKKITDDALFGRLQEFAGEHQLFLMGPPPLRKIF